MNRVVTSNRLLNVLSTSPKVTLPVWVAARSHRYASTVRRPSRSAHLRLLKPVSCRKNSSIRLASTSATTGSPGVQNSSHLPDTSNHYSIFPNTLPDGPPPAGPFDIKLRSLRHEFLRLQARFHPDKFSPEQKAESEALSSRINEAYKVLRDPLTRAQFLLQHNYGIDVTSEDNNSHPTDVGILMEVMEAQESIEAAETHDQILALKEENEKRIEATLKLLDDAFSSDNAEAARMECIRLRYWASLQEGLHAWDGKGSDVRLVH